MAGETEFQAPAPEREGTGPGACEQAPQCPPAPGWIEGLDTPTPPGRLWLTSRWDSRQAGVQELGGCEEEPPTREEQGSLLSCGESHGEATRAVTKMARDREDRGD